MGTYSPPLDVLLTLGRPLPDRDIDYSSHGIGREQIPELIRLMADDVLSIGEEPQVYGPIHAWTALGQFRAEEAIEPMLDLLARNAASDDWIDWIGEEVPISLAEIGPRVLPAAAARLEQSRRRNQGAVSFATVLKVLAEKHPETRAEAIGHLSRFLEHASDNEADVNGFVIADLMDLKAVEAWPTIERAFAEGHVDEWIAGDAGEVKWRLGLGPEPPRPIRYGYFNPMHRGMNSKQRFDERMKKKKAEKKKRQQERKRK